MEYILFDDLFYYQIINNLNCVDLYQLCQVCKQYRNTITKKHFIKATIIEIRRRLPLKSINEVASKKGVVSGSFIIQCILNIVWQSNPGFYTDYFNKHNEYEREIFINYYFSNNIEIDPHRALYCRPISSSIDEQFIDLVETYPWVKPPHISAIIKMDNIHEFIDKTFDFDICKNSYWYTDKDNLQVKSFNQILSRKAISPYSTNHVREKKYIDRGFKFIKTTSVKCISREFKPIKKLNTKKMILSKNI